MRTLPLRPLALAASFGVSAVLVASTTQAAQRTMILASSPTGLCQAALPNFEGAIRKRPLAIVNEGTAEAFVTCSFPLFSGDDLVIYNMTFRNRAAVARTINCTAVFGSETGGTPVFVSKSLTLAVGLSNTISWNPNDNIGTNNPTSTSCQLPPGVSIGTLATVQNIEIGM